MSNRICVKMVDYYDNGHWACGMVYVASGNWPIQTNSIKFTIFQRWTESNWPTDWLKNKNKSLGNTNPKDLSLTLFTLPLLLCVFDVWFVYHYIRTWLKNEMKNHINNSRFCSFFFIFHFEWYYGYSYIYIYTG